MNIHGQPGRIDEILPVDDERSKLCALICVAQVFCESAYHEEKDCPSLGGALPLFDIPLFLRFLHVGITLLLRLRGDPFLP